VNATAIETPARGELNATGSGIYLYGMPVSQLQMDCHFTYVWIAEGWLYVAAVIDPATFEHIAVATNSVGGSKQKVANFSKKISAFREHLAACPSGQPNGSGKQQRDDPNRRFAPAKASRVAC
jgi:hypothetical protein